MRFSAGKVCLALVATTCIAPAQPEKKDGGSRSWELDPKDGTVWEYVDTFTDYYRGGKMIARVRDRKSTLRSKSSGEELVHGNDRNLLFTIDGKGVASVKMDDTKYQHVELGTPVQVYFSSGFTGNPKKQVERYTYFCIPSKDYFEYITILDSEVTFPDEELYKRTKHAIMTTLGKKGYLEDVNAVPVGENESSR